MSFNITMFDSKINVVVVTSEGYSSIVPHSHEFVELVYVVNGNGEHNLLNKKIPVTKGDLFVIADKEISHSICPIGDATKFSLINVIFPYDFFKFNYSLINPEQVFSESMLPSAKIVIEKIKEEYNNKQWQYEEVTYSLTKVLLTEIFRNIPTRRVKNKSGESRQKQVHEYIDKAVAFIHDNYDKQITISEVAEDCGLCKQYLQRLFKKERDTTIIEYLIKYRIEQSCRYLLNTDYSVAKVAQMVGFNDLKYYYVKFKTIVGQTPSQYKQKFGETK